MQQSTHWLFAGVLLAAALPMTVWGYGPYDYRGNSGYVPYAGSTAGGHHYSSSLRVQTAEAGDGYYVRAYLQGLAPEDIQVYVRRNRLILRVVQDTADTRGYSQWRMNFSKRLRLPYDADWMQMRTTAKDGVMEIYIPRRGQQAPVDPTLN